MDCDICFEQYNTGANTPKLTPCGHTVCLVCLQRSDKRECPLCRTAYVPHPVHLATNYTLLRVMEERYGDDRIGPRLLFPTPPPVPPPVPPPDWPPATATPSPPEGPTVIIVRSTQAQESSGQGSDKRVCKVLVNVAVLICLVIFLVVRYCR
ncbi:RING finger protein 225-like [Frankliniella occidentalis]|uniref:RING finger protein 225-like n=1 Tax=Frankliniella occidentalis TaxID=133901 RepID=A0A9C6X0F7_FRAOC|nr:RING finger protein 225-like [Frankliniella occidentalis]